MAKRQKSVEQIDAEIKALKLKMNKLAEESSEYFAKELVKSNEEIKAYMIDSSKTELKQLARLMSKYLVTIIELGWGNEYGINIGRTSANRRRKDS